MVFILNGVFTSLLTWLPDRTVMNRRIEISLRIFITAYITVLFAVIIPLHTHHDPDDHDDCSICLLADQPFAATATISFAVIAVALACAVFIRSATFTGTPLLVYQTRAPPCTALY